MKNKELDLFEEETKLYLSNSSISTYTECSQKWYFTYKTEHQRVPTEYTEYGSSIHHALELFHSDIALLGDVPDVSVLHERFEEKWNELSKNPELELTYYKVTNYLDIGIKSLTQYFDTYYGTEWFNVPVGVELEFDVPIVNPYTGEIIDPDYTLRGYIDFVQKVNNRLLVVDHKTASRPYDNHAVNYGLQLSIYRYALEYLVNTGVIDNSDNLDLGVAYNFLMRKKTPDIILIEGDRDRVQIERMLSIVKNTIKGIKNEVFIPNMAAKWCQRCEFYDTCMTWKG